jgi:hypothetical protein
MVLFKSWASQEAAAVRRAAKDRPNVREDIFMFII